jgi:hypothetical protein
MGVDERHRKLLSNFRHSSNRTARQKKLIKSAHRTSNNNDTPVTATANQLQKSEREREIKSQFIYLSRRRVHFDPVGCGYYFLI